MKDREAGMILVTAFEPFGGEELNPTQLVLEMLPDAMGGHKLEKLLLPVEFMKARKLACAAYDSFSPDAVIMLGQAGGRSAITPETTGRNIMNARIPDNAGYAPASLSIEENGPEELHSTFCTDRIIGAVRTLGISCERSDNAGEYVCNTLLYGMLYHNNGEVPTGFIHVPYIPRQGHDGQPSMELEDICKGIAAAIETVIGEQLER